MMRNSNQELNRDDYVDGGAEYCSSDKVERRPNQVEFDD